MNRQFTLAQIEKALDSGIMLARMGNGNCWKCRRNGRTQTWKTRPGEFCIPVKAGFRATGKLTHQSTIGLPGDGVLPDFIMQTMCPESLT